MGLRRRAGLLLWAHPALRQGPAVGASNLSLDVLFRLRIAPRVLAMYRCRGAWVRPNAASPAVSAGAGAEAAACLVGLSPDLAKTLALVATVFALAMAVFATLRKPIKRPSNKLILLLLQHVVDV